MESEFDLPAYFFFLFACLLDPLFFVRELSLPRSSWIGQWFGSSGVLDLRGLSSMSAAAIWIIYSFS